MVILALLCRCGTSTGQQASSLLWWQGSICLPLSLAPAESRNCHFSGHSLITGGGIGGVGENGHLPYPQHRGPGLLP